MSTLELSLKIETNDSGKPITETAISVDGKPIGFISRFRVDADADEAVPSIEIDLLRGKSFILDSPEVRMAAQTFFNALKEIPGVKCNMPAPRIK